LRGQSPRHETADDPGDLKSVDAKIIGIDTESDLAVVKIDERT